MAAPRAEATPEASADATTTPPAAAPPPEHRRRKRDAYEAAIEAAGSPEEKARLQKLRNDFDIPGGSTEWPMYALFAGRLGPLEERVNEFNRQAIVTAESVTRYATEHAALTTALSDVRGEIAKLVKRPDPQPLIVTERGGAVLWWASLCIGMLAIALAAWGITSDYDAVHYAAVTPRVAALLETKGGRAAEKLLHANGDALADELARCKQFLTADRRALTCTFFADGEMQAEPLTAADRILDVVLRFPAWPVVLTAALAFLAISIGARRPKKPKKHNFPA
jgi:hypothetical protein